MTIIERIGRTLFGASWQTEVARALDVNDRTVRRWQSGATPLPDGVLADLRRLAGARRDEIETLLAELGDAASHDDRPEEP